MGAFSLLSRFKKFNNMSSAVDFEETSVKRVGCVFFPTKIEDGSPHKYKLKREITESLSFYRLYVDLTHVI